MKNTTQKGFSTALAIIIAIVIIVLLGLIYLLFRPKPTVAPVVENPQATTTSPTASSTTPTPTAATSTTNVKMYSNATLGFSVSLPWDFLPKKQPVWTSTGDWSALFGSDRGTITITIVKGAVHTTDLRLQTTSATIGSKTGTIYNTRRDACDATIAYTDLDSDYSLQFTFESCGQQLGSLYTSKDDIVATLASVQFLNQNTRLYVSPKLGFAFRYPTTWSRPTVTTTSVHTTLTFGQDAEITSGGQYSSTLKRNLTIDEVVTGALTSPGTTDQKITLGDHPAHLLVTTPPSGPQQRTVYAQNKNQTDIIIMKQSGVDSDGLNLILSSFSFIK
jgi:hypothetical protein